MSGSASDPGGSAELRVPDVTTDPTVAGARVYGGGDVAETSTFAMSSIIFLSVAAAVHTLKPLRRKGKRPTPFERMGS